MKWLVRIIAYSIAVGFVLVVGLIIVASYLMGYKLATRDRVLEYRDKIIERIDSFQSANGHLPESMSEVGFKQMGGGSYYYEGYYDQEGNCYRKFWNYKQNGRLIYEADR